MGREEGGRSRGRRGRRGAAGVAGDAEAGESRSEDSNGERRGARWRFEVRGKILLASSFAPTDSLPPDNISQPAPDQRGMHRSSSQSTIPVFSPLAVSLTPRSSNRPAPELIANYHNPSLPSGRSSRTIRARRCTKPGTPTSRFCSSRHFALGCRCGAVCTGYTDQRCSLQFTRLRFWGSCRPCMIALGGRSGGKDKTWGSVLARATIPYVLTYRTPRLSLLLVFFPIRCLPPVCNVSTPLEVPLPDILNPIHALPSDSRHRFTPAIFSSLTSSSHLARTRCVGALRGRTTLLA